jgi:hypothetical protein
MDEVLGQGEHWIEVRDDKGKSSGSVANCLFQSFRYSAGSLVGGGRRVQGQAF